MIYRAIGLMSGSSLDGLDIAFIELTETAGKWTFEILETACMEYGSQWNNRLQNAVNLSAYQYALLHTDYGRYTGQQVNHFIEKHGLQHKVHLVASHGHTTFHSPAQRMTAQLGDGAAIAVETKLTVISDLRAMDVATGGQGAPIVPIGEKLLFPGYDYFLNLGGIANISINKENYVAFDVCAANRVLNMLAAEEGMEYDRDGAMASSGTINDALLQALSKLDYYSKPYPKSLANSFGTDIVFPLIKQFNLETKDALRTYTEHISKQIFDAVENEINAKMLVTGGGAFNGFLIERLKEKLAQKNIELVVPDEKIIAYKEALIMALLGVLRWREEVTVIPSVTGASTATIGGAMWIGNGGY